MRDKCAHVRIVIEHQQPVQGSPSTYDWNTSKVLLWTM